MSDGHDDAYQDGYRAGLVVAEETIVEWLREQVRAREASIPDGVYDHSLLALDAAADAIERGDHNKP